jgi:hypothetical protein
MLAKAAGSYTVAMIRLANHKRLRLQGQFDWLRFSSENGSASRRVGNC